ncbi:hypothetical protein MKX01_033397 [Papaver californicum]|nr:hypothetical protein MKX01_033397 [Papaver californicum]
MAPLRGVSHIIRQHAPSNPCFRYLLPCQLLCSRGIVSKLFIKGLSFHTSEEALSEAFSKYGQVVEVMDKVSDRSKGFGFVTFASLEEAKNAISEMNIVLDGRAIFVDNANSVRTRMFDETFFHMCHL